MKVSFLCNSFLALPSINFLAGQACLAGLATSAGNTILSSHIKMLADSADIPFASLSYKTLADDLHDWIAATGADVVIVQTFPYRIPAACLELPPLGFYNLHPSPLPDYKGPDPIFWQLLNDEPASGVTLHKMEASFDTGPIFHIEAVPVHPFDTYGLTQSALSYAAVAALEKFLACPPEAISLRPQASGAGHSQPKPDTEKLVIDWAQMSALQIHALIRACNPHQNGAITFFRDVMTRLLEVNILSLERVPRLGAGTVIAAGPDRGLQVLCADEKAIQLEILHVEEGYFSGRRFCEIFEVRIGEKFSNPAFLS